MKTYDEEGRLLINHEPVVIDIGTVYGTNFAIVGNVFYFKDSDATNPTPYYEAKTQVFQGIANVGLADSGVALP